MKNVKTFAMCSNFSCLLSFHTLYYVPRFYDSTYKIMKHATIVSIYDVYLFNLWLLYSTFLRLRKSNSRYRKLSRNQGG